MCTLSKIINGFVDAKKYQGISSFCRYFIIRLQQWWSVCIQIGIWLSKECLGYTQEENIEYIPSFHDVSEVYKKTLPECYLSSVYVCSDYSLLGNGIKNWKYVGSDLSGKAIIKLLHTTVTMYRDIFEEVESVAYPPIGINRYIERGFNQARELAYCVSKTLSIPMFHGIYRFISIAHQSTLSRKLRLKNGVLVWIPISRDIVGKTVLLVDDVVSTGTTANGLAKDIIHAGARRVILLAIARSE